MLKSFGVTGGDDAKNLDDNERAQVKGAFDFPTVFFFYNLIIIVILKLGNRQYHRELC